MATCGYFCTATDKHALMSERTMDGLAAPELAAAPAGRNPSSPRARPALPSRCTTNDPDGKRRYTVAQIAAEFGVTRPTIYRHLEREGLVSPS